MRAAVDDVQHRHRQHDRVVSAEPAEEGDAGVCRRRLGDGQRHAEQRVRSEVALVRRAVQLHEAPVQRRLVGSIQPFDCRPDYLDHVPDGAQHALASEHVHVAVTQLDGLVHARGRARWNRRASERAGGQSEVDLYRGVAARVEDLPSPDTLDGAHASSAFAAS